MTYSNETILVTGGTGSFGKKFIKDIIRNKKLKKIIIYSRDEMKQWDMANKLKDKRIKFIIGDVRDKDRLNFAMKGVDLVVHSAATKIVPTAEYNPIECVKTNIIGAYNVIESSFQNNIKKVIALSTDKASNPINLYGATKLVSDKLFISANDDSKKSTKFSVVRYGNVLGSRGSIIPFFKSLKVNEPIPITDKRMTRFFIKFDDAVNLVNFAFKDMLGAEIYVKKIPSIKIIDLAKALHPNKKIKIIGVRPGEKIHEQMISKEDSDYTYEYKDYYKILSNLNNWHLDKKRVKNGKKVKNNFVYDSNNNTDWLSIDKIKKWIDTL